MDNSAEFLALLSTILGVCAFLWNKLDKIWKGIGETREDYVKHSVCSTRRRECINHIKETFTNNDSVTNDSVTNNSVKKN